MGELVLMYRVLWPSCYLVRLNSDGAFDTVGAPVVWSISPRTPLKKETSVCPDHCGRPETKPFDSAVLDQSETGWHRGVPLAERRRNSHRRIQWRRRCVAFDEAFSLKNCGAAAALSLLSFGQFH